MKKLTMTLVILVFITSGLVLADQVPTLTPSGNIIVQDQTIDMKTKSPTGPDLLFDQPPSPDNPYSLGSSQEDSIMGMDSRIADNFTVPYLAYIDSLVWWGGLWNFPSSDTNEILDFWVEIYPDSTGFDQPQQNPIFSTRGPWDEVFLSDFGIFQYYRYSATITPFLADPTKTYWMVFRATLIFKPQWGWELDTFPAIGDGQECYFKGNHFGFPDWTSATDAFGMAYEVPFQVYGTAFGIEEGHATIPEVENISFNSLTSGKIRFKITLLSPTNVEAQIFDLAGRMVGTILNSELPAGENVCEHKTKLPTGVYFVEVKTGNTNRQIGKILIVR